MKYPFLFFVTIVMWLNSVVAQPLDLADITTDPIGKHALYLKEAADPLTLAQAIDAFKAGAFTVSEQAIPTFGIGARPIWLRLAVNNYGQHSSLQRLVIETSWLDKIDVYFLSPGKPAQTFQAGDAYPFAARPIQARFFQFKHVFEPGQTEIYLRVATPDPMVIPIYLTDTESALARQTQDGYIYGFLYGVIIALLAYNLMLYLALRARRYLYYSVYLGLFVLMNMSYTGHAYAWIWPVLPGWQLWANHILILLFPMAGLLFATNFLNTQCYFPRLHKAILFTSVSFAMSEVLAIIFSAQAIALIISFVFVFIFSLLMVYLGSISLRSGNQSAKYFLAASVTHVSASTVTTLTTWGFIPYTKLGFHAIEIGMMLDAVLLALALADLFRISQDAKLKAERLAKIDPLTGIYNRRAFYQSVKPLWATCQRKCRAMSIVILDIDRFKTINDNYGHSTGDAALVHTAQTLLKEIRSGDILARWGGEEFIVFLPETNLHEAYLIAERFRQDISNMFLQEKNIILSLTASFGVAQQLNPEMSLDELILAADNALYQAKQQGRNRVCSAEMNTFTVSSDQLGTSA